jgi:hypothetical protein
VGSRSKAMPQAMQLLVLASISPNPHGFVLPGRCYTAFTLQHQTLAER